MFIFTAPIHIPSSFVPAAFIIKKISKTSALKTRIEATLQYY